MVEIPQFGEVWDTIKPKLPHSSGEGGGGAQTPCSQSFYSGSALNYLLRHWAPQ